MEIVVAENTENKATLAAFSCNTPFTVVASTDSLSIRLSAVLTEDNTASPNHSGFFSSITNVKLSDNAGKEVYSIVGQDTENDYVVGTGVLGEMQRFFYKGNPDWQDTGVIAKGTTTTVRTKFCLPVSLAPGVYNLRTDHSVITAWTADTTHTTVTSVTTRITAHFTDALSDLQVISIPMNGQTWTGAVAQRIDIPDNPDYDLQCIIFRCVHNSATYEDEFDYINLETRKKQTLIEKTYSEQRSEMLMHCAWPVFTKTAGAATWTESYGNEGIFTLKVPGIQVTNLRLLIATVAAAAANVITAYAFMTRRANASEEPAPEQAPSGSSIDSTGGLIRASTSNQAVSNPANSNMTNNPLPGEKGVGAGPFAGMVISVPKRRTIT